VEASNPLAELFLIDGSLRLVARGVGLLSVHTMPGIFKIRARVGRQESETIRLIEADTMIPVDAPCQVSPLPLPTTARTHEYQVAGAYHLSRQVQIAAGHGAQIFIMARMWTPNESGSGRNPAEGLSLHTWEGRLIADYSKVSEGEMNRDSWSACNIQVDPGPYRLRARLAEGSIVDQVVYAAENWQTQLFLLNRVGPAQHEDAEARERQMLDFYVLSNMAVSMTRLGNGFNPGDEPGWDLARVALRDDRPLFSPIFCNALDHLLERNPILGIFGAHLMLMARDYDLVSKNEASRGKPRIPLDRESYAWALDPGLFERVIVSLRELLGGNHPDVEALSLSCAASAMRGSEPFSIPPMLRRSWSLLVRASNENSKILPLATWARIAEMIPVGPFLAWKPKHQPRPSGPRFGRTASILGWFPLLRLRPHLDYSFLPYTGEAASHDPLQPTVDATDEAVDRIRSEIHHIEGRLNSASERQRLSIELDVPRLAIERAIARTGVQ
jgi:hypothetical protein